MDSEFEIMKHLQFQNNLRDDETVGLGFQFRLITGCVMRMREMSSSYLNHLKGALNEIESPPIL